MNPQTVRIQVPTLPAFARTVRMTASNLAVLCDMSVDDVEDVRMAAEEGFVYACSTAQDVCEIAFFLSDEGVEARFSLGVAAPESEDDGVDVDLDLTWLLMTAVSDECVISDDASELRLFKAAGVAYVE